LEELVDKEVSASRCIWLIKILYHNLQNQLSELSREKLDKRKEWTERLLKQLENSLSKPEAKNKILYVIRLISHSYHSNLLSPDVLFQWLNSNLPKSTNSLQMAVLVSMIGEYIVDISNHSHDRLKLIFNSLLDSPYVRKFIKVCFFCLFFFVFVFVFVFVLIF